MSGKIGDYRLDGHIGRGGMAVVYLAQDERLDRTVALKIIAPELARDAAFRTRFLHESRAAAAVGHPNIIPVYDAGDAGGVLYVAMRYVQGGDARSLLNRLGPLPFGWAWSITAQVASALDAAHAHRLIHRDVKPAHMLLDADSPARGGAPRPAHRPRPPRVAPVCLRQSSGSWPRPWRRTRPTGTPAVASSLRNCGPRWGSFPASRVCPRGRARRATPGRSRKPGRPPRSRNRPRRPRHPRCTGPAGRRPR